MERYLSVCLESLLVQNLGEDIYEVIIVNDESTDKTLKLAEQYSEQHANIHVVDKTNAGVGAARNSGFDRSTGEYVYFLDPDDYLSANVLGRLLNLIPRNDLDILTFKSKPVTDESHTECMTGDTIPDSLDIFDGISYIAHHNYQNEVWWYIIKKEFMQASGVRFIEGRWMEDAIFTTELICKAKRIAHVALDAHRYRILPTSAMRNKTPEHYNKVIYDNEHAAHFFDGLIKKIPESHSKREDCVTRLKTRQQSFVFFLLVRLMKSDISLKEIPKMLKGFSKKGAYPLSNFIGKDYFGTKYTFLVFVFNSKLLIRPFMQIYRTLYRVAK